MILSKACFAMLLGRTKGAELVSSDSVHNKDGRSRPGHMRGSVGSLRSFNEQVRVADAMTDGENAEEDLFPRCRRTQNMCESCTRNCACKTDRCSWNGVCYDKAGKGDNGCACISDSNCKSGRCAANFKCQDKLDLDKGCLEDDDCKSGVCGGRLVAIGRAVGKKCLKPCEGANRCRCMIEDNSCAIDSDCEYGRCIDELCPGKKEIPFMVTNVALSDSVDALGEKSWGYHVEEWSDEFKFLKDITYCGGPAYGNTNDYRIYGQVVSSPDEWKSEVAAFIAGKGVDHVLYSIHGYGMQPKYSFYDGWRFTEHDKRENQGVYTVIPINWRNIWGNPASYDIVRNNYAQPSGKDLAKSFDYFSGATYSSSVVLHSMGNYVFRHFAQAITSPEQVFQNVFMVAADARSDMFSASYNPSAPGATGATGNGEESIVLDEQSYLEIPEDELIMDGGYAITNLTNHTHVVWNKNDKALVLRETFQTGGGEALRNALGKYGDRAEAMTAPYFKERVTYHDFTDIIRNSWAFDDLSHNYQWREPVKNIYKGYKFQKGTAPPSKVENDGNCTTNADCASNYCSNNKCEYGPPGGDLN